MKTLLLFFGIVFFTSCEKEEKEQNDTELPVIIITSPSNNQVFTGGQTVTINAAISDNNKLEEIHLEIINLTSGGFVAHEHFTPGTTSYTLTKTFTAQASKSYQIKVIADDASDNTVKAEVLVSAN